MIALPVWARVVLVCIVWSSLAITGDSTLLEVNICQIFTPSSSGFRGCEPYHEPLTKEQCRQQAENEHGIFRGSVNYMLENNIHYYGAPANEVNIKTDMSFYPYGCSRVQTSWLLDYKNVEGQWVQTRDYTDEYFQWFEEGVDDVLNPGHDPQIYKCPFTEIDYGRQYIDTPDHVPYGQHYSTRKDTMDCACMVPNLLRNDGFGQCGSLCAQGEAAQDDQVCPDHFELKCNWDLNDECSECCCVLCRESCCHKDEASVELKTNHQKKCYLDGYVCDNDLCGDVFQCTPGTCVYDECPYGSLRIVTKYDDRLMPFKSDDGRWLFTQSEYESDQIDNLYVTGKCTTCEELRMRLQEYGEQEYGDVTVSACGQNTIPNFICPAGTFRVFGPDDPILAPYKQNNFWPVARSENETVAFDDLFSWKPCLSSDM